MKNIFLLIISISAISCGPAAQQSINIDGTYLVSWSEGENNSCSFLKSQSGQYSFVVESDKANERANIILDGDYMCSGKITDNSLSATCPKGGQFYIKFTNDGFTGIETSHSYDIDAQGYCEAEISIIGKKR